MAEEKKKLLGLSLADLEAVAAEMAMPRFTAKQMAQWLYFIMMDLDQIHLYQRLNALILIGLN